MVVLDLVGQLTLGDNSLQLKDKINSALLDGTRDILLNLGDVSYIDSGGLGQLIASFKGVKSENGRLKLFNLGKKSKELLAMYSWSSTPTTPNTRRFRVSRTDLPDLPSVFTRSAGALRPGPTDTELLQRRAPTAGLQ